MRGEAAPTQIRKRGSTIKVPLQGLGLLLARVGWVALVVSTLAIFFASLPSMCERAAELGGICLIEARVTGGTRVLVQLPLAKEPLVSHRLTTEHENGVMTPFEN